VGGTSEPQWIDTDNGAETTKIIGGLNASTTYQFRVRANSHVPGEWSQLVKAKTLGDGEWGVPASMYLHPDPQWVSHLCSPGTTNFTSWHWELRVGCGVCMGSQRAGTGLRSCCSAIHAAPCKAQPWTATLLFGRSTECATQPGQPEHRAGRSRPAAALGHHRLRVRHLPHHPLCPPGTFSHQEELFPPAPHLHIPVWLGECCLPCQDSVPSSPRPSPIQVTLHSLQSGCSQTSPPHREGAEPTLARDTCPVGTAVGQRGARCL